MQLQLVLLLGICCCCCFFGSYAQNLTTTNYVEDYIIHNQRQYAANILRFENEIAAFRANYLRQVNALDVQTSLIEQKLIDTDERLNPLELLEGISKHCVQKYRGKITTVAVIKKSISSCSSSAISNLNGFLSAAETTKANLNNYYNTNLKNGLADCLKKHAGAQTNYTLCVTQVITTTNSVTISYQKTFTQQMQTADCSGENRIKIALDCGFTALYDTIGKVGETIRLIENCIAGLEYCPPCREAPDACENILDLSPNLQNFTNATIQNPFYGMNSTIQCVHVNFS